MTDGESRTLEDWYSGQVRVLCDDYFLARTVSVIDGEEVPDMTPEDRFRAGLRVLRESKTVLKGLMG